MNVADSIRRQITPIHPEGYLFIAAFAVATLILCWIWSPLGWIGLIADRCGAPISSATRARVTPVRRALVISPADGVVCSVGASSPPPELGLGDDADAARLHLHVGVRLPREPRAGRRAASRASPTSPGLSSTPTSTRRARTTSATAWSSNRRAGTFGVVQIAGLIARRIVCFSQEGDTLGRRRPLRPHPLRLARRRLSAGRLRAAGRRRLEGHRGRDGPRGVRRAGARRQFRSR